MIKFIIPLLLTLALFTGCDTSGSVNKYSKEQIIAADTHIIYAAFKNEKQDVTPVGKKHARADCPTNGWITHGDGHKTRCPDCDPPYVSTETKVEEPVITPIVPPAPTVPKQQVITPKTTEQKKVQYYDQRTRRWYYYYTN